MAREFTTEEFEGVVFQCESKDAQVGWYHVCEAVKDGNVLVKTKCHYYNRTWESYPYESVYENCKDLLRKLNAPKKIEIDEEFWNGLTDREDLIHDFGKDHDGNYLVVFDSWEQQELMEALTGDEKLTPEQRKILKNNGITRKKLKEQYINCIDDYVFSEEYQRCYQCGCIVHNDEMVDTGDYEYVCEECFEDSQEMYVGNLIEKSQDDFRQAIPVNVDTDVIEAEGFTFITDDFGNIREFGEYQYENYNEVYLAQDIHDLFYGTVVKLTGVGQFQTYFNVAVPDDEYELAQLFADGKIKSETVEQYHDNEITWDDVLKVAEATDEDEEE